MVEREVWRSLEVISPTRTMLATRISRLEEESGDDGVEEREGRPLELSAVEEEPSTVIRSNARMQSAARWAAR